MAMGDDTDAGFFSSFFYTPPSEKIVSSKIQICAKYDDFYNLTHENRGVAIIFNHEYYDDTKYPTREGTNLDRDRLIGTFTDLEFDIRVYNDLKYGEIYTVLNKVSQEDHSHNDCLVVCVMSHGEEGKIQAKDHSYPPSVLWEHFTGSNCQTLAGKPKMFFVQACRGSNVDEGTVMRNVQTDSNRFREPEETYTIPTMADILIMYATYEGYYSWRSPLQGSWFIQSLCKVFEEYGNSQTLLNLLTLVNRRVAMDYKSSVPRNREMDQKKQICTIVSMLTRFVAFPKKNIPKLQICPPKPE